MIKKKAIDVIKEKTDEMKSFLSDFMSLKSFNALKKENPGLSNQQIMDFLKDSVSAIINNTEILDPNNFIDNKVIENLRIEYAILRKNLVQKIREGKE